MYFRFQFTTFCRIDLDLSGGPKCLQNLWLELGIWGITRIRRLIRMIPGRFIEIRPLIRMIPPKFCEKTCSFSLLVVTKWAICDLRNLAMSASKRYFKPQQWQFTNRGIIIAHSSHLQDSIMEAMLCVSLPKYNCTISESRVFSFPAAQRNNLDPHWRAGQVQRTSNKTQS